MEWKSWAPCQSAHALSPSLCLTNHLASISECSGALCFPSELVEKYHLPHGIVERTKWMQDPWVKAWCVSALNADSHCCLPPRHQLPLPRLLVPLSVPLKFSFMLCSSSRFLWPLPHLCAHQPFQGSRGTHHFAHVSSCWCGLAGVPSTFSVLLGFFYLRDIGHWSIILGG